MRQKLSKILFDSPAARDQDIIARVSELKDKETAMEIMAELEDCRKILAAFDNFIKTMDEINEAKK